MDSRKTINAAKLGRWLVIGGLVLAIGSALAIVGAALGSRFGLWHFRAGFAVLFWAFWFALAGTLASLSGLIACKGRPGKMLGAALVGIAVGAVTVYIPWNLKHVASTVPMIHDISTDTQDPPQFVAAEKLRGPGDHPVTYDGPEVAALQRKAYPDLGTATFTASSEKVFEAAKAAVAAAGLQLVDADPGQGRIEANQTSFLWGFTDDVVIRVREAGGVSRVDVRSKSRVGRSDLGQNAKRISKILAALRADLR